MAMGGCGGGDDSDSFASLTTTLGSYTYTTNPNDDTDEGDGDGDTAGDGDGEPAGDGDPSGDGDGDPSGDGDGDPSGDGDGEPNNSECDPFEQDCPFDEKCVPYASSGGTWDANKCVPVYGNGDVGDSCNYGGSVEATDDCGTDSYCWGAIDNVGTCTMFCEGTFDDPICPQGQACLISNDNSVTLCLDSCDPLAQDCGPGQGCYLANGQFQCAAQTSDLPTGEACGFINDCAPGHVCASANFLPDCNGANCCAPFCDTDLGNAQCNILPGTVCVLEVAPNIGICRLAP
jgi:hypothetical protein